MKLLNNNQLASVVGSGKPSASANLVVYDGSFVFILTTQGPVNSIMKDYHSYISDGDPNTTITLPSGKTVGG